MAQEKPQKTEAEVMKRYLIDGGINPEDIIIEDQSMDTVGNIYYSSLLLEKFENIRGVYVITSLYHIPRVKYICSKIMPQYSCQFIGSGSMSEEKHHEDKVLEIYKKLFQNALSREDIFLTLCKYLPGYSTKPKWTREYIISLMR